MNRLIRLLSVGLVVLAPVLGVTPAYAASASLSLSPASGSVSQGSILTVSIYENSGSEPVNAARAVLSYPTNLLDFVSIGSSSAFSIVAQNSGGGGSVQIDRGALPAVTGKQQVASVRFKAKTNTGTAGINFASGSSVVSANSNKNILGPTSGGSYGLKAAAAPAPASPSAASGDDKVPPTVTNVTVSDVSTNTATVSWTTSEPANSQVDYGVSEGYGLTSGDDNFVTDHKVILNSSLLSPGVKYHFVVKSVDPSGNAVTSGDQTFKTKGAALDVTVVNQKKKAVKDAKVAFEDVTGTTDKNGRVALKDLPIGKITGVVTYKDKQTVVNVDVKPINPDGTPQAVTLSIKTPNNNPLIILIPLIAVLALVVLLLKRNSSMNDLTRHFPKIGGGSSSSGPTSSSSATGSEVTPNSSTSSSSPTEPNVIKPTTTKK